MQTETVIAQINANLEGMALSQLRKVLRAAQEIRHEAVADEAEPTPPAGPKTYRKSHQRVRVETVHQGRVGTQTSFNYGTFKSTKSLDTLCRSVGGPGWYEIKTSATAQTVKKVR